MKVDWLRVFGGGILGFILSGLIAFFASTNLEGNGFTPFIIFGGVFLGGFVAGFINKDKNFLSAMSSSLVAGGALSFAQTVLLLMTPEENLAADYSVFYQELIQSGLEITEGEASLIWISHALSTVLLSAAMILSISFVGGLVAGFVMKKKNVLKEFFVQPLKKLRTHGLPVIVLVVAASAINISQMHFPFDATIGFLFSLIGLLLLIFALTGSMRLMSGKKEKPVDFIVNTVKESKHVIVAFFLFFSVVPFLILIVLLLSLLLPVWNYSLNSILFLGSLGILVFVLYFVFASFVLVIAFKNKSYLHCIKDSFVFVKKNFVEVILLHTPLLLTTWAGIIVALSPVDVLIAGDVSMALTNFVLVYFVAVQAVFYSRVKK